MDISKYSRVIMINTRNPVSLNIGCYSTKCVSIVLYRANMERSSKNIFESDSFRRVSSVGGINQKLSLVSFYVQRCDLIYMLIHCMKMFHSVINQIEKK